MTLLSTGTYEDAQYQNDAPIGEQPPIPTGAHNIELSWDRSRGYMRIIIPELTERFHHPGEPHQWWFKEYLGKAVVTGTDNERGRLNLRAIALLRGETLVMYRPLDSEPHPLAQGMERKRTHNRLCYRRSSQDWRLRDERLSWNDPDALKFVKTYVGDLSAEWNGLDKVAHIYHNGTTVIDDQHICHLYDPDLSYD